MNIILSQKNSEGRYEPVVIESMEIIGLKKNGKKLEYHTKRYGILYENQSLDGLENLDLFSNRFSRVDRHCLIDLKEMDGINETRMQLFYTDQMKKSHIFEFTSGWLAELIKLFKK